MGRRSSIEQLPQSLFDAINRALEEGKTIEQVVEHMQALGTTVSKSAVGRHKKKIEEVAAQLRKSRVIAEAIGKEFGDQPDDKLARLNVELMHDQLTRIITATGEDGEPAVLSPKDANFLADALYRLSSARKVDTDRIVKEREKARTEARSEAAATVERELKKLPGISAETVKAIRHQVLGVAE